MVQLRSSKKTGKIPPKKPNACRVAFRASNLALETIVETFHLKNQLAHFGANLLTFTTLPHKIQHERNGKNDEAKVATHGNKKMQRG